MKLKRLIAAASVVAVMGTMAAVPVMADGEETAASVNLLSSATLKKADYNNGTDKTSEFTGLTNGVYTDNQTLDRSAGTHTYYAVYEVNADISEIATYYTSQDKGGNVVFYGSNSSDLALINTPPTIDLKWDGDNGTIVTGPDAANGNDFPTTYNLTFIGNPGVKGTETSFSSSDTTCYKKSLSVTGQYKYIVVLLNGWTYTNVSEIEVTGTKSLAPLKTGEVIWAQDIIDRGGNHQGNGNSATDRVKAESFGNFINVDNDIKVFFESAVDSSEIGNLTRINALDNQTANQWQGHLSVDVTAETAGSYTAYILCNTGDSETGRLMQVTNETNETNVNSGTTNSTIYSTKNGLRVLKAENLSLGEGVNSLKLQAPSGSTAPNFIALYITKTENEVQPKFEVNTLDSGVVKGTDKDGNNTTESAAWIVAKITGTGTLNANAIKVGDKTSSSVSTGETSFTLDESGIILGIIVNGAASADEVKVTID